MPPSTKVALLVLLTVSSLTVAAPIPDNNTQVGDSYSGQGGHASGGSVNAANPSNSLLGGPLINVLSDNAGDAGTANSGNSGGSGSNLAVSQAQSSTGNGTAPAGNINDSVSNSYSGTGGQSDGGSVDAPEGLVNVGSNNAGSGGKANSGTSGPLALLFPSKTRKTTKVTRVIHFRLD